MAQIAEIREGEIILSEKDPCRKQVEPYQRGQADKDKGRKYPRDKRDDFRNIFLDQVYLFRRHIHGIIDTDTVTDPIVYEGADHVPGRYAQVKGLSEQKEGHYEKNCCHRVANGFLDSIIPLKEFGHRNPGQRQDRNERQVLVRIGESEGNEYHDQGKNKDNQPLCPAMFRVVIKDRQGNKDQTNRPHIWRQGHKEKNQGSKG